MDELPPNARAALAQMKHAHDPDDPEAKARVQARVAAAVGLAAGATGLGVTGKALASAGNKTLWARLAAHKLATTLSVAGVATVGAVTAPKLLPSASEVAPSAEAAIAKPARTGRAALTKRAAEPSTLPAEAPSAPSAAAPHQPEPASATPERAAVSDPARPDSLPAELALLGEADRALAMARPALALELALRHAARFPHGALREERMGLEVIARCQLGERAAGAEAAEFLRAFPAAVLGQRVKLACTR